MDKMHMQKHKHKHQHLLNKNNKLKV